MELETINKLFLELSQVATAKTARELELEDLLMSARCIAQRKGEQTAWERGPTVEEFVANFISGRLEGGNHQCWPWLRSKNERGYGQVMCSGKNIKAHKIAYLIHNRDIPDGLCVLHRCDNPSCVNPHHLFLGTQKTNVEDMCAKRRHVFGEAHKHSKLTHDQVLEIIASKESHSVIARRFGVSPTLIGKIKTGKRWPHCHAEALSVPSPLEAFV